MAHVIGIQVSAEVQALCRTLLEPRGFTVEICPGGMEAAELLAQSPQVAIIELRLPDPASVELIDVLRHEPRGTRLVILAVATDPSEEELLQVLSAGADDFLTLPVRKEELLARLRIAMERRQGGWSEISSTAGPLAPGTVLANRFEILAAVSSGGFSQVYRARDVSGKWPGLLAMKVFRPEIKNGTREHFSPQVLREAAKLASLSHPNIIRFYDLGYTDRYNYLITEFAEGESLEAMVHRRGRLPAAEVVLIGYEVASAMEYMDARRILHRDIKPSNIMISASGSVKVVDFGLAKSYGEHTLSETPDVFHGTAQYVSPERIKGQRDLDVRSDIYSLGLALYNAATGTLPFNGPSVRAIMQMHFEHTPPPILDVVPDFHPQAAQLIGRMMMVDRAQRPALGELIPTLCTLMLELAHTKAIVSALPPVAPDQTPSDATPAGPLL